MKRRATVTAATVLLAATALAQTPVPIVERITTQGAVSTRVSLFSNRTVVVSIREAGVQAPYIGDHIEIEGERYKVMDTDPVDYFGNTQVGLTLRFVLVRVQAESIKAKPRTEQPGDIYPQSGLRAAMERSGSVSPQPAQNEQVTPPARGPSPVWPGTAAAAAPGRTLPVPPVPDDGAQLGAHDLGEDELGDDGE